MTLNGGMALILRYFTAFCSLRGALRKSGWQSHNHGQLRLLCLVVNICSWTAWRTRHKYAITAEWKLCSRFINSRLKRRTCLSIVYFVKRSRFSFFWYFEVRVRYHCKQVHVRYLISWWVLVSPINILSLSLLDLDCVTVVCMFGATLWRFKI